MASDAVASAFDRLAAGYDEAFGTNPVGRLFRYVFQERLRAAFPPGARVLDLGCGTGEDAAFLAACGADVVGLDVSGAMVEKARQKAEAAGAPSRRLRFEVRRLEDVAGVEGRFDGAYSDFGALNCADLAAVGRGLAARLRSGAPVVLSLMGRHPLPAMLERALTGQGLSRGRQPPRVGGLEVPARYPARRQAQAELGGAFHWSRGLALGVLVPGPAHASWAVRHAQAFGLLAAAESVVRRWPVLRGLGDHIVLEGVRR